MLGEVRALCGTGQGTPEKQTTVLTIPGGTGGEQGWGHRPWQAVGQQARCFPKQEQREGRSSLSPSGKAQSLGHGGQ